MVQGLAAAFDALCARLAAFIWTGRAPLALRGAILAGLFARSRGGGVASRVLDRAGRLLAQGGGRALARDPVAVRRLVESLMERGATPLLIAGDSHSRLHLQRDRRGGRWLLPLHILATGASARGLANARSRSGYGLGLRETVERSRDAGLRLPLVLVFGQVDVEFVFLFKRLEIEPPAPHDREAFAAFCETTVEAYAGYAADVATATRWPVTLAAIFPPALSDEAWRDGYLNAHIADAHAALPRAELARRLEGAVVSSLAERTAQHAAFNRRLRQAAVARGLGWIEAFNDLLGAGGVVSPTYVGPAAGRDHHLDAIALRPAILDNLWASSDPSVYKHAP